MLTSFSGLCPPSYFKGLRDLWHVDGVVNHWLQSQIQVFVSFVFLLIEIERSIPRGVRHAGSLGEENGDWNHIHSNMETKLTLFSNLVHKMFSAIQCAARDNWRHDRK